ncbi:MAG: hypothetical protein A2846_02660 [Candidatus Doudnabacteria bacterium RIFCSPHIGHO2_01_FULL_49_9]|uniref:Vitamin K epoxide reductase domain-containing protein n=1 Tax=Candidatus Doudnabacteria bacterium RIFCSPHIGHO2_01_FULL_49_9 TaxID=1817827 RepID=A0A1F5P3I4_9BACT|nr:MAG: hypothetical protein A2846_02660 [Candidatus Doudnabacteria bacterium RIFCSPHIGHO2_01_FULL_49_9]
MIYERILIVLAFFGLMDSLYLWYEHRTSNATLICPLDHDCSAVTESKWSTVFGVRNEILGSFYYLVMLAGGFALVLAPTVSWSLDTVLLLASLGGFVFSAFLTALQFAVIKDYCFYCLISAGLSALIFINCLIIKYHA